MDLIKKLDRAENSWHYLADQTMISGKEGKPIDEFFDQMRTLLESPKYTLYVCNKCGRTEVFDLGDCSDCDGTLEEKDVLEIPSFQKGDKECI